MPTLDPLAGMFIKDAGRERLWTLPVLPSSTDARQHPLAWVRGLNPPATLFASRSPAEPAASSALLLRVPGAMVRAPGVAHLGSVGDSVVLTQHQMRFIVVHHLGGVMPDRKLVQGPVQPGHLLGMTSDVLRWECAITFTDSSHEATLARFNALLLRFPSHPSILQVLGYWLSTFDEDVLNWLSTIERGGAIESSQQALLKLGEWGQWMGETSKEIGGVAQRVAELGKDMLPQSSGNLGWWIAGGSALAVLALIAAAKR